MPASRGTVIRVLETMERHLDRKTILALLLDIRSIDGNASFRATTKALVEAAAERYQ